MNPQIRQRRQVLERANAAACITRLVLGCVPPANAQHSQIASQVLAVVDAEATERIQLAHLAQVDRARINDETL